MSPLVIYVLCLFVFCFPVCGFVCVFVRVCVGIERERPSLGRTEHGG